MIVTEAEAKLKKCCNLVTTSYHSTINCTASKCMAWRWYEQVEEYIYAEQDFSLRPPQIVKAVMKPKEEWTGYCGLAGKR